MFLNARVIILFGFFAILSSNQSLGSSRSPRAAYAEFLDNNEFHETLLKEIEELEVLEAEACAESLGTESKRDESSQTLLSTYCEEITCFQLSQLGWFCSYSDCLPHHTNSILEPKSFIGKDQHKTLVFDYLKIEDIKSPLFTTEEIYQIVNDFQYPWDFSNPHDNLFIPDYKKSPYYETDPRVLDGSYIPFQLGDLIPENLKKEDENFHEIAWIIFGYRGYDRNIFKKDIADIRYDFFEKYGCMERNYMETRQYRYEMVLRSLKNEKKRHFNRQKLTLAPYMDPVDLSDIQEFVLK